MPIEIRELIIRARIEETDAANQSRNSNGEGQMSFAEKEAIIASCVEQVMKMIEDKKER